MKSKFRRIIESLARRFGYSLVGTVRLGELTRMAAETKAAVSLETHLSRLLERYQPDCVFDVGANDGGFARMLRNIGYQGWIVSFEPLPSLVKILNDLASTDKKWMVEPCALGAVPGELTFHQMAGDVFSSFLKPGTCQPDKYNDSNIIVRSLLVPVKTINNTWPAFKAKFGLSKLMLKLDTQGYDLEVFAGASECLNDIPLLMSELACISIYEDAPDYRSAMAKYLASGYRPAILSPISFTEDLLAIEMDGIFVKTR